MVKPIYNKPRLIIDEASGQIVEVWGNVWEGIKIITAGAVAQAAAITPVARALMDDLRRREQDTIEAEFRQLTNAAAPPSISGLTAEQAAQMTAESVMKNYVKYNIGSLATTNRQLANAAAPPSISGLTAEQAAQIAAGGRAVISPDNDIKIVMPDNTAVFDYSEVNNPYPNPPGIRAGLTMAEANAALAGLAGTAPRSITPGHQHCRAYIDPPKQSGVAHDAKADIMKLNKLRRRQKGTRQKFDIVHHLQPKRSNKKNKL